MKTKTKNKKILKTSKALNKRGLTPSKMKNDNHITNKPLLIITFIFIILAFLSVVLFLYKYSSIQKNNTYKINQNKQSYNSSLVTTAPNATSTPKPTINLRQSYKDVSTKITKDGKRQVWVDSPNERRSELWVSNTDGTEKKLIAKSNIILDKEKVGDYEFFNPVWNPEGTKIAYIREVIDYFSKVHTVEMNYNIHIINYDGRNDHLFKANIITPIHYNYGTDLNWTEEGISYSDSTHFDEVKVLLKPF